MTKDQLIEKITAANAAYAQGMPFLTDSEYDIYWRQLHAIDPNHPCLYHTANVIGLPFDLESHHHTFFGTQKAFEADDLKPFLMRFSRDPIVLEPKYDGCAAIISHRPDGLKLVLEGDGIKGQDVTRHLPFLTMGFDPKYTESVEIVIPHRYWNESYGSNPRNAVADI